MKNYQFIRNQSSNRGIVIAITLFTVLILLIFTLGIASIGITKSRACVNYLQTQQAYYLARTGINYGVNHVRDNFLNNGYVGGPNAPLIKSFNENENFRVEIWAHPDNLSNPKKLWRITSEGNVNNSKRRLIAWATSGTFADFVYFVDSFSQNPSISTNKIWFTNVTEYDGRVHSNGFFNIIETPKFHNIVTSSNGRGKYATNPIPGKDDPYWDPVARKYTQGSTVTSNSARFYHYNTGYSRDYPIVTNKEYKFQGGVPEKPLPYSFTGLKDKADKNYYEDLKVRFDESGQIIVTPISNPSNKDYLSTDNQIIHTTGKIYIEGGRVKGRVTIAADKRIEILNDVVYVDKTRDVLGVVSEQDIMINTDPYTKKDLTLHGSFCALNMQFHAKDCDKGILRGYLYFFGGTAARYAGGTGSFWKTSTGVIYKRTGYISNYTGDPKLNFNPPPGFPSTGEIRIILLKDESSI
jgi:hypothetical protein